MGLTISDIKKDIEGFEARIETARQQIAGLPNGRLPFKEHKKREKIQRDCEAEVKHCQQLIVYAREGIIARQREIST